MRVTQLASGDLYAGAESQLRALVLCLRDGGHADVDVVLLNEGVLAERLRAEGILVTVLDERQCSLPALIGLVRRHCVRHGTQVLHTHRYKENVVGSVVRLMNHSVRTLRTEHGVVESSPRGIALRRRTQKLLDRICARFIQWPIVSVSHPLAERVGRWVPPSRVRVVENGVLVAETEWLAATPVTLQSDERRLRIGFFGRLVPVKRVDLILRIARLLETESPGMHAFYVFGEGPLRAELEAEAHRLGISKAVRFMGFTQEVAANLKAMDLLLLTSDHEGLPMIVLEAMVLRVPVVSHAVGAIPALLEGGRAGTLLTTQDPEAFARAIAETLGDRVATAERTERAQERVVTRYSAARTAAEYAAIYHEMLGERPRD